MDVDFMLIVALLVMCGVGSCAFESWQIKRARREWFAGRGSDSGPDLELASDPAAAEIAAFVAQSAGVPAGMLCSGDRLDELEVIGLDYEELLPFVKRRFHAGIKRGEFYRWVKTDEGCRQLAITLSEFVEMVRTRKGSLDEKRRGPAAITARIVGWRSLGRN